MSTVTTGGVAKPYAPDTFAFAASDVIGDAAILKHSTVAGAIEGDEPSLRIGYAGNATASVVAEGAEIDETAVALSELVVQTVKIANVMRYSNEIGRQKRSPDELAQAMARAIIDKADALYLSQVAPTAPDTTPVAGLYNTAGLEAKTAVATNIDKLIELRSAVETNGGNPAVWIVAPSTLEALAKLKTATDHNTYLLGSGTEDGERRLLGLPLVVNKQLAAKTGLLVDPTQVYSAVSQLYVATSSDAAFTADSTVARATMRLGFGVPRPDRLGKFAVS